ncbi:MAG: prepilin-type N-terminal cleavage/methylation domain-containing protein [Candidatus Zixiibacteriota bacterium]|nr:MAG: prepilin-type N-terminal cleavage/methylation domain-containing protein [candidate division Zixibacteria bacterium]
MYHITGYHWKNDRGLSLLEVLVAMIVLAVGILGLAPMVVLSIEGNSISRDFIVATELAKEQLELYEAQDVLMKAKPAPALPTDSLSDTLIYLPDVDGYSRTVTIQAAEGINPPNLVKVTIDISWTDKLGKVRAIRHSTLMMNN